MAYLAMLAFPIAAIVLFSRYPLQVATVWTLSAGFLFLPQGISIDLPFLPAYDRTNAPLLMAAVLCVVVAGGKGWKRERDVQAKFLKSWLPTSLIGKVLVVALILSPVLTVLTNQDPVRAPLPIRGLSIRDLGSMFYSSLSVALTALLARRYLSNDEGQRIILIVLASAGLIYAPFVIYEWRMSPSLHSMIYGYNTFEWSMTKRFGGFRPVVFQRNGLVTSVFMVASFVAAIAAIRHFSNERKTLWRFGTGLLMMAVVMLNSFGAWILAAVFGTVALLLRRTTQLLVAMAIGTLVLIYPVTQNAKIFPNDALVTAAEALSPERSRSLDFRLTHERKIMDHVQARPFLGWGIWGRGDVYDERGRLASVTDSLWILVFKQTGLLGYTAKFGLMCVPLILVYVRRRRLQIDYVTCGLCLVQCVFLVDQLVNDTANPFMWLIAGSLLGRIERRTIIETQTGSDYQSLDENEDQKELQPARGGVMAPSRQTGERQAKRRVPVLDRGKLSK